MLDDIYSSAYNSSVSFSFWRSEFHAFTLVFQGAKTVIFKPVMLNADHADCRLQTVQTVQTVQAECYFFFTCTLIF